MRGEATVVRLETIHFRRKRVRTTTLALVGNTEDVARAVLGEVRVGAWHVVAVVGSPSSGLVRPRGVGARFGCMSHWEKERLAVLPRDAKGE